jgi:hypothetical protein
MGGFFLLSAFLTLEGMEDFLRPSRTIQNFFDSSFGTLRVPLMLLPNFTIVINEFEFGFAIVFALAFVCSIFDS